MPEVEVIEQVTDTVELTAAAETIEVVETAPDTIEVVEQAATVEVTAPAAIETVEIVEVGPIGPAGPAGADGPAGEPGNTNVFIQEAQPADPGPWVWFEIAPDGALETIWTGP